MKFLLGMCQKVGFELHSESFHILSAYTSHLLLWSMFNISPGNGVFCPIQQELGLWTGPEQQSRAVVNILSSHLGTSRLNPSFLPEVELSLTRNWVSRRTSSFFFFGGCGVLPRIFQFSQIKAEPPPGAN